MKNYSLVSAGQNIDKLFMMGKITSWIATQGMPLLQCMLNLIEACKN